MNADLEKAWRNGLAPFHGLTLYVEEPVAFLAMQRASRIVCNHLKSHFNDEAFFAIKDWHEHDGVVFDEEPFDLSTVEKALPSPELLGALDSGDHQVRRGIFPASMQCLWRIGLEHCEWHGTQWHFDVRWNGKKWMPVTEPYWYFSLSGSNEFVATVQRKMETDVAMQQIIEQGAIRLNAEPSTPYFSRIHHC